jgi:membrane peptidoglycan carboxypeptidase
VRTGFKYSLLGISLMWGMAVGGLWPRLIDIREKTRVMADAHKKHEKSHPGWSFPAKIWSDAAPLDLPTERLMEHARIRWYTPACPALTPGEYCAKDGLVIPRGGVFAEGRQPAGMSGWTRPVALEPILIGYLIGPDGEVRDHLPIDEAPQHLLDAIIAAEDSDFFSHPGVNPLAFVRAGLANAENMQYEQGASTLTMQVVRSLSQNTEKTASRKIREAAMAVTLDGYIGKKGVLQMYLDAPYLGQKGSKSICGFEAAARHYWGKSASALSLAEAATLAGILPAPGRYGPDVAPQIAKIRRDRVLQAMTSMGYDVADARLEPIEVQITPLPATLYPSYMQATRAWLEQHLPTDRVYGAGLNVYTALDVVAQEQTDEIMMNKVAYLEKQTRRGTDQSLQAAAALVDPFTGALVAAFGGTDATATGFNRATQARRQAGSSFKPLVYALAFSRMDGDGKPLYTAADTVPNMPRTFENTDGWRPRNVGGKYSTTIPLAQALKWSSNIGTASLLEELGGPRHLVDFAERMGFEKRWLPEEMGLALGQGEVTPLEMASFVAAVVNGGRRVAGSPVLFARDAARQIPVGVLTPERPVMTPEAAALTRELMRGVVQGGTGGSIRGVNGIHGYKGEAVGKTGTTDKELDLWFVGGTPYYSGAVWLGYDTPARVGGSASELAAPLWGWWMAGVHKNLPDKSFEGPELEFRRICIITGLIPKKGCLSVRAPFLPGTAPKKVSGACATRDEEQKVFVSMWERRRLEAEGKPIPGRPKAGGGRKSSASSTPAATGTTRSAGPDL